MLKLNQKDRDKENYKEKQNGYIVRNKEKFEPSVSSLFKDFVKQNYTYYCTKQSEKNIEKIKYILDFGLKYKHSYTTAIKSIKTIYFIYGEYGCGKEYLLNQPELNEVKLELSKYDPFLPETINQYFFRPEKNTFNEFVNFISNSNDQRQGLIVIKEQHFPIEFLKNPSNLSNFISALSERSKYNMVSIFFIEESLGLDSSIKNLKEGIDSKLYNKAEFIHLKKLTSPNFQKLIKDFKTQYKLEFFTFSFYNSMDKLIKECASNLNKLEMIVDCCFYKCKTEGISSKENIFTGAIKLHLDLSVSINHSQNKIHSLYKLNAKSLNQVKTSNTSKTKIMSSNTVARTNISALTPITKPEIEEIDNHDFYGLLGKILYNKRQDKQGIKIKNPTKDQYLDNSNSIYFNLDNLLDYVELIPFMENLYGSLPNFVHDLNDYYNIIEMYSINTLYAEKNFRLKETTLEIIKINSLSTLYNNINSYNNKYEHLNKKKEYDNFHNLYSYNINKTKLYFKKNYVLYYYGLNISIKDIEQCYKQMEKLSCRFNLDCKIPLGKPKTHILTLPINTDLIDYKTVDLDDFFKDTPVKKEKSLNTVKSFKTVSSNKISDNLAKGSIVNPYYKYMGLSIFHNANRVADNKQRVKSKKKNKT